MVDAAWTVLQGGAVLAAAGTLIYALAVGAVWACIKIERWRHGSD